MSSIIKVDTVQDTDGNNIINENANTITIGASGDTITIPAGATITNSGTATGFGGNGAANWTTTVKTADFTAVAAGRYGINADNNNVNITLPASPTVGDWIRLIDVGNWSNASYSPKLLRNGSTIEGTTTDFELDVGQNIVEVLFINNTWNIYAAVGQRGPQGNQGDSGTLDSSNFSSIATSVALSIALG